MSRCGRSAAAFGRVGRVLPVVFVLVSVATSGLGGVAAAASGSSQPVGIFADESGTVTVLYADESTAGLGVSGELVGPAADLDDDKYLEAPYVDDSGTLHVVDTRGNERVVVEGDVASSNEYLATGDWDGDGRNAVFYQNASGNGNLYRVEIGSSPVPVEGPDGNPIATNSPLGIGDFDGDGDEDLVFLGSSSTVKYYDGTTIESTGSSSFDSNNGLGIGAPADFDGDGTVRVPVVYSGNLQLLAADGSLSSFSDAASPAKAPVAAADWTDDASLELLYVGSASGELHYADGDGSTERIGGGIATATGVGVAPAAEPPAPAVTNYTVTNPTGRELRVAFDASQRLVDISVDVDGPAGHDSTLTEGNFTETTSGDGYRYAATTTVPVDGNYTATLTLAADADGTDGADGQRGEVSVQTPFPAVGAVSLSDASDGDGYVAGDDAVTVAATVTNESALANVTADAAAFGAGTVSLGHTSGDEYAATFTVDAAAVPADGSTDLTVTATNEYDHAASNDSGTLFVDTTPPTADAGPDATIREDTSLTFDGDGSTDDAGIESYTWTFDDGTTATGVTTTRTYPDPGTYTVDLTVTDVVGHSATDATTVTVENVSDGSSNLTVTDATLVDGTDDDGYVGGGDAVTVTAAVENDTAVSEVRADASAFGAGTVTLSHTTGDEYATTVTVDAGGVATDGETDVTVTAVDEYTYVDTATTGTLFVDTTPPTADAGSDVTVDENTTVVFDGDGSTDNARLETYAWTFDDGTTATGTMVKHTYADPGTYTPELAVTDVVGHTANATLTVTVTDVAETNDTETDVVYVDRDDGDGGDDATIRRTDGGDGSDARVRTTVSSVSDRTVEVRLTNVETDRPVALDFEGANGSAPGPVERFRFASSGASQFSFTVTNFSGPPADVPHLTDRRGVSRADYFEINHTLPNEDLHHVGLSVVLPPERASLNGSKTLVLYRYHDGSWRAHDARRVGRTANGVRYHAHVPGLSTFAVAVRRPRIDVVGTTLDADDPTVGEDVAVSATLENEGRTRGTRTVSLRVDGESVATRTVSLAPDADRTVTFVRTFDQSGTYRLAVDDARVGTVAVDRRNDATTTAGRQRPGGGNRLPVAFVGLAAVLAVVSAAYLRYRD